MPIQKGDRSVKHKRMNRDAWGFSFYPYYQTRLDCEFFHGTVCLIRLTDGGENYWQMPRAGRVQVTGGGMCWLELIPDGENRVITVKYFPDGSHDPARKNYPAPADRRYPPSVWYVDITDGTEYDECGIAVYIDKYLDVIFTPEGDVKIDDRDELDAAFLSGELTRKQYDDALDECERVLDELCADIRKTDAWCAKIRQRIEEEIARGLPVTPCREVLERQGQERG